MKRVFKYELPIDDVVCIKMPAGAQALTVDTQHGDPQLWVLVNPDAPMVAHRFRVAGTGHPIESKDAEKYVGSFQLYSGSFVGHLFDLGEVQ